jgi:transcriptional regulator with XRE-family HTH domain
MSIFKQDQIGPRIKALRVSRGLSLAHVAEKINFSVSYLSKIENSKNTPPVSTLAAISEALGVHIADIFADAEPETTFTLVKKDARKADNTISKGYSYTPLASLFPNRLMDPYVITIPADSKGEEQFQHKGQELMVILSGRLMLNFGEENFVLEPGDCFYFDASIRHSGHALDGNEVEALMVMTSGGKKEDV